jgi:hypothetical protein
MTMPLTQIIPNAGKNPIWVETVMAYRMGPNLNPNHPTWEKSKNSSIMGGNCDDIPYCTRTYWTLLDIE